MGWKTSLQPGIRKLNVSELPLNFSFGLEEKLSARHSELKCEQAPT